MDARGAWPLLPVGFALIAVGQTAISMTAASMNIGVVVALTVVVYAGVGLVLSPSQRPAWRRCLSLSILTEQHCSTRGT